jgi:N-acetylglutamate synthase-like GNAT family acetyltransferase
MNQLRYLTNHPITAAQFADLCVRSELRRPVKDLPRMQKMLEHSQLTFTVWDGDHLIGIARALTDFSFCCYLSDLAVDKKYQHQGIGRQLIDHVREQIGEQTTLLLLAAPTAMNYYPKVGFAAINNGWIISRQI